jgi:hypothetical protein
MGCLQDIDFVDLPHIGHADPDIDVRGFLQDTVETIAFRFGEFFGVSEPLEELVFFRFDKGTFKNNGRSDDGPRQRATTRLVHTGKPAYAAVPVLTLKLEQ